MMSNEAQVRLLSRTQLVARPLDEVFAFFADASNLEALTPGFLHFRFLTRLPVEMRVGTRIDYSLSLFGIPVRWRTRIAEWQAGMRFIDVQEYGPYRYWRHTHTFEGFGRSTLVSDLVEYVLPFGPAGALAHALFVQRLLRRIFDFRRDAIQAQFAATSPGSHLRSPEPTQMVGANRAGPPEGGAGGWKSKIE